MICLSERRVERLVEQLKKADALAAVIIGRITEKSDGRIILAAQLPPPLQIPVSATAEQVCAAAAKSSSPQPCCCGPESDAPASVATAPEPCCCGQSDSASPEPTEQVSTSNASQLFGSFIAGVNSAQGTLTPREKQLINWALVVLARCRPCVRIHRKKALEMGISPAELDQIAWLAVSMGGAPVMMFYKEAVKEITESE